MNAPRLIDLVLRSQQLELVISGPLGRETRLRIRIPDLSSAPRALWGDWGPMYRVAVSPERPIHVEIEGPAGERVEAELPLRELEVDSPSLALTRSRTPLVMKLPHFEQGCLRVFYDAQGQALSAEFAPDGPPVTLLGVDGARQGAEPQLAGASDARR